MTLLKGKNGMLKPTKNRLMKGQGATVVLDRDPSVKEPIVESKFYKEFRETPNGEGKKRLKSNLIALPNNKRSSELQSTDVRVGEKATRVMPMFPSSSSDTSGNGVKNSIKFPSSLSKNKVKRNNIKLVF